mmetsp:Transcript_37654/g.87039  ORF Transcript_37654/g.87039 Transcript_37654/m.87039 type:complete len:294 (-) Transcript_37654:889-1770(-)
MWVRVHSALPRLASLLLQDVVIRQRFYAFARLVPCSLLMLRWSARRLIFVLLTGNRISTSRLRRTGRCTVQGSTDVAAIGQYFKPVKVLVPMRGLTVALLREAMLELASGLPCVADPVMRMWRILIARIQDIGCTRTQQSWISTLRRLLECSLHLRPPILSSVCSTLRCLLLAHAPLALHALLEQELVLVGTTLGILEGLSNSRAVCLWEAMFTHVGWVRNDVMSASMGRLTCCMRVPLVWKLAAVLVAGARILIGGPAVVEDCLGRLTFAEANATISKRRRHCSGLGRPASF